MDWTKSQAKARSTRAVGQEPFTDGSEPLTVPWLGSSRNGQDQKDKLKPGEHDQMDGNRWLEDFPGWPFPEANWVNGSETKIW